MSTRKHPSGPPPPSAGGSASLSDEGEPRHGLFDLALGYPLIARLVRGVGSSKFALGHFRELGVGALAHDSWRATREQRGPLGQRIWPSHRLSDPRVASGQRWVNRRGTGELGIDHMRIAGRDGSCVWTRGWRNA
jgi:hypothetical protein